MISTQQSSQTLNSQQNRTAILNRKQTQVEFLQQENNQLKQDIKEIQNLNKINKEALKVFTHNDTQAKLLKQKKNDNQIYVNEINTMQKVMQSLYEENNQLLQSIDRLIEERNIANGKALITEQMFDVAERQQLENSKEQEGKLLFLQKQVKEYQQLLNQKTGNYIFEGNQANGLQNTVELQSIPTNNILQNENLKSQIEQQTRKQDIEMKQIGKQFIKYRDILEPKEQTLKMYEEFQKYNALIDYQNFQMKQLNEKCQQLQNITIQQGEDLIKLQENMKFIQDKICSKCQETIQNQNQDIIGVDQVIEFHRNLMNVNQQEILEKEIEQRMLSPLASPLPDRVNHIQSPRTLPLLELSKALHIQQINIKKHTDQQEKKLFSQPKEYLQKEIKKQKQVLAETRNQLALEMLSNKKLEIINDQLQRQINELENKEEVLLFSQQLYEDKWKKIYHGYKFYRNYYKTHKDQINHTNSRMQLDSQNNNDHLDSNRMIKESQKNDTIRNNKSIIDFNPDMDISQFNETQLIPQASQYLNINNQNQEQDLQQDKQRTVQYLLTLAKGVYGTFNYQKQNQIQLKSRKYNSQTPRLQRSNSNPNLKILKTQRSNNNFSENKSTMFPNQNYSKNYTQIDGESPVKRNKVNHRKNVSALLPQEKQQNSKYIYDIEQDDDQIRITQQKLDDSYDNGENNSSERYKAQFEATDNQKSNYQQFKQQQSNKQSIPSYSDLKENLTVNTEQDDVNKSNNIDKSYNMQYNQDLEIRGHKKSSNISKNLEKEFELEDLKQKQRNKRTYHKRGKKNILGNQINHSSSSKVLDQHQKEIQGIMQSEDLIQAAKPVKTEYFGDDISFDAQNKQNFGSKNLDDIDDDKNSNEIDLKQNNNDPVLIQDFEDNKN